MLYAVLSLITVHITLYNTVKELVRGVISQNRADLMYSTHERTRGVSKREAFAPTPWEESAGTDGHGGSGTAVRRARWAARDLPASNPCVVTTRLARR